jgi:tetratricopeptide (TPR) repeat protein
MNSFEIAAVTGYPEVLGLLGRYREAIGMSQLLQVASRFAAEGQGADFETSLLLARQSCLCGQWYAKLGELEQADQALERSLARYQAARSLAPANVDLRPLILVAQRERAAMLERRGFAEAAKLAAEQAESLARLYDEERRAATISGEPAWLRALGILPQ